METAGKQILSADKGVYRLNNTVHRPRRPWSASVRRYLLYLEAGGFPVEHSVALTETEEITVFAQGEMVHPHKWTDEALYEVGVLVGNLHRFSAAFPESAKDVWQPWCLREIGRSSSRQTACICCHGDIAPWNMITQNGHPSLLVDFEFAGPLDPMVELSRVCWLFPQLVDDDLGSLYELPPPEKRAEQVRLICEGYRLPRSLRKELTSQIIETVICETAHEAIDPSLSFTSAGPLWGFAWRTRSLYWIWRHRTTLQQALAK